MLSAGFDNSSTLAGKILQICSWAASRLAAGSPIEAQPLRAVVAAAKNEVAGSPDTSASVVAALHRVLKPSLLDSDLREFSSRLLQAFPGTTNAPAEVPSPFLQLHCTHQCWMLLPTIQADQHCLAGALKPGMADDHSSCTSWQAALSYSMLANPTPCLTYRGSDGSFWLCRI